MLVATSQDDLPRWLGSLIQHDYGNEVGDDDSGEDVYDEYDDDGECDCESGYHGDYDSKEDDCCCHGASASCYSHN